MMRKYTQVRNGKNQVYIMMQMNVQLFLSPLAEIIIRMQIKIIQCWQIPVVGLEVNFLYLLKELVTQKWS